MHTCPSGYYFDGDVGTCESCQWKCGPELVADCKAWCTGSTTSPLPAVRTAAPLTGGNDVTSGDEPFNWYIPVALATCIFIAATTLCVLLAMVVYVRRKKRHHWNRKSDVVQHELAPLTQNGQLAADTATVNHQKELQRQTSCTSSSSNSQCQTCLQPLPLPPVVRVSSDAVNATPDELKVPMDEGYLSRNASTSSGSSSGSCASRDSSKSMERSTSTSDIPTPAQQVAMEARQKTYNSML